MPIIASQHTWKDADHIDHLLPGWPEDCHVQWGGSGLVLGGAEQARLTAFFEAFPNGGGFIRGEGETIREAEARAFEKYRRTVGCEHLWSRKGYTNGLCFCRRCGGNRSVMPEIVTLGAWREPISCVELEMAMSGWLAPSDRHDERSAKHRRRIWLRLRQAGIDLPPIPDHRDEMKNPCEKGPYAVACSEAIFMRIHALGGPEGMELAPDKGGMGRLLGAVSRLSVKLEYEDWLKQREGLAPENGNSEF